MIMVGSRQVSSSSFWLSSVKMRDCCSVLKKPRGCTRPCITPLSLLVGAEAEAFCVRGDGLDDGTANGGRLSAVVKFCRSGTSHGSTKSFSPACVVAPRRGDRDRDLGKDLNRWLFKCRRHCKVPAHSEHVQDFGRTSTTIGLKHSGHVARQHFRSPGLRAAMAPPRASPCRTAVA